MKKVKANESTKSGVEKRDSKKEVSGSSPLGLRFVALFSWLAITKGVASGPKEYVKKGIVGKTSQNDRVGHSALLVSRETQDGIECRYLSLWPAAVSTDFHRTSTLHVDPTYDSASEGGQPDQIDIFFTLDIDKLWEIMDPASLEERFPTWSLMGSKKSTNKKNSFKNSVPYSESCAGAVYQVLKQTGTDHLEKKANFSNFSLERVVAHPNNLSEYATQLVTQERSLYRHTVKLERELSSTLFSTISSVSEPELAKRYYDYFNLILDPRDRQDARKHLDFLVKDDHASGSNKNNSSQLNTNTAHQNSESKVSGATASPDSEGKLKIARNLYAQGKSAFGFTNYEKASELFNESKDYYKDLFKMNPDFEEARKRIEKVKSGKYSPVSLRNLNNSK